MKPRVKNPRACDVCKKPTRALVGVHGKCMSTYLRLGRRSQATTAKKKPNVFQ